MFILSEQQQKWFKKNKKPLNEYQGAIGGGLTYHFTPTSLGVVCKVTLSIGTFEDSIDLTEYDEW